MRRRTESNQHSQYLLGMFVIVGIPGLIVSVLFPLLQIPYALIFFGLFATQIIGFEQAMEDPEHSSTTHYERYSRWNWYNYAVAGLICADAFLFVVAPFHKGLAVAMLWIASVFIVRKLEVRAAELLPGLVSQYVQQQMPKTAAADINKVVKRLLTSPGSDLSDVAKAADVTKAQTEKISEYIHTYLTQNGLTQ